MQTLLSICLFRSLDGPGYFVDGLSNTQSFKNFWAEAAETFTPDGVRAIEPADVIVVDYCAIYKCQAEAELTRLFNRMGVTYFFLPVYLLDLNSTKRCFN